MLTRLSASTCYLVYLIFVSAGAIGAENPVDADTVGTPEADTASNDSVSDSNIQLQQINHYQDQIAEFESQFGAYHESLLEPLSALAQIYVEDGDFEAAGDLLSRHLQVMRTEQSLDNPALIPYIEAIIANSLRLGEFAEVSDHFDHIRHLRGREGDPELVLQAMEDQANWFLTRVYLDEGRLRVRNFRAARELFRDMLDYAEDSYGEDNPAIIDWLYKEAVNQYRLMAMLNADDGLGSDAVDQILRFERGSRVKLVRGNFIDSNQLFGLGSSVPILDGDQPIGEDYLEDGLRDVNRIRSLLEDSSDLEAQAMAEIYYADFLRLLDRGSALRNYRKAYGMLEQAGIATQRIDAFFSRPVLLPVARYFNRLEQAIAYQQSSITQNEAAAQSNSDNNSDDPSLHLGQFVAWSESLPYSQQPPQPRQLGQLDFPYFKAQLSFTINRNGETSSVKVLDADSENNRARRDARNGVRAMQFRPRIVEGRSKRMRDVQMEYLLPLND